MAGRPMVTREMVDRFMGWRERRSAPSPRERDTRHVAVPSPMKPPESRPRAVSVASFIGRERARREEENAVPYVWWRDATPYALLAIEASLSRLEEANALLFEGLQRHWLQAVASGRGEAWKQCGHSIIELLGEPPSPLRPQTSWVPPEFQKPECNTSN